ncbi:MAG: phage holin family protein [Myxococcota bacterium]
MVQAILGVVVLAVAVFAVSRFMPGIKCKSFGTALVVALGLSAANFVAWKLLFFLTLPFMVLTGFLGYFVVTAGLLWLVDQFVDDFHIEGVGTLVLSSAMIAAINAVLRWILPGL